MAAEADASAVGDLGIAYSELGDITGAIESYRQAYVVRGDWAGRWAEPDDISGTSGMLQLHIGQFRPAADHIAEADRQSDGNWWS